MKNYQFSVKKEYDSIWHEISKKKHYKDIIENHRIERKAYYDALLRYSKNFKCPKVMEIGCGTGIDINIIMKKNKFIKGFAADLSFNSIKLSRKIASELKNSIEYIVSDTLRLPFKDGQLDMVFSQGLIEHFANPNDPIKEQLRVIKEGGFLIINVPQKFTGYTLMKKRKMRKGEWHLGWEREFSYRELKKIQLFFKIQQREIFGYQYWRSWLEPSFVLKDLYDKLHRRNPLAHLWLFKKIKKIYNFLWKMLEKKIGHYFLQNIIIIFQKTSNENTSC